MSTSAHAMMPPHACNKIAAREGRWFAPQYCRVSRRCRVNASYARQTLAAQRRFFSEAPGLWRFRNFMEMRPRPRVTGALTAFVLFLYGCGMKMLRAGALDCAQYYRATRMYRVYSLNFIRETVSPLTPTRHPDTVLKVKHKCKASRCLSTASS